jgi:hypothetical protein
MRDKLITKVKEDLSSFPEQDKGLRLLALMTFTEIEASPEELDCILQAETTYRDYIDYLGMATFA